MPAAPTNPPERQRTSPPESNLPTYTPYPVNKTLGTQQDFYQPSSNNSIHGIICEVVNQEGPMSLQLATRRVAAHWGLGRVHTKALEHVRRLLPRDKVLLQSSPVGVFLWPAGTDPSDYRDFRVPGVNPESVRNAEDLPVEEIANAALFLLRQYVSAPEEELIREISRLFGFQRTGKSVEDRMRAGIDLLIKRGAARGHNGSVILEDR